MLEAVTRHGGERRASPGAVAPRPESPLRVVLAMSPLKGDRMELVIQKATELGVAEIRPVVTVRTDAAARPALKGARQERWEKVASGAAEQCGRATVPERRAHRHPGRVPGRPAGGHAARPAGARRGAARAGVAAAAGRGHGARSAPPADGSRRRSARLRDAGFQPVGLGPRILRAETAAIAALTAVQVLWGDL